MTSNREVQIARVVDVAQGEVSRSSAEHPRGSNLTKYGKWYGVNGVPWCAIGVSWVFAQAGLDFGVHGPRTAWVPDYRAWYRARGRWSVGKSDVRVGDVITYRGGKHVELVTRVTGRGKTLRFWAVGFNTSWRGSGGSFADGVFVAENERTNDRIDGTGHPFYGVTEGMVKVAQQVTGAKVDGDLGPQTMDAVKHWQRERGLTADGIPGASTYQAMVAGVPELTVPAVPTVPAGGASVPALKPPAKPAPAKPAGKAAPAFPLPRGAGGAFYYGPPSGPVTSVSGRGRNSRVPGDVVKGAGGRWYSKGLKRWQEQMRARGYRITADGRFGDETERIVRYFQKLVGVKVDGKIGPDTWARAWTEPVR